jgi:hypothetical protein
VACLTRDLNISKILQYRLTSIRRERYVYEDVDEFRTAVVGKMHSDVGLARLCGPTRTMVRLSGYRGQRS